MNPHSQSIQNDLDGLSWLHRFGWLRSHELGPLLWPSSRYARHQAHRLARSWRARGLVLERELPARAGRALVLAAAGVRLLAGAGIAAATGKDFGETHSGRWVPPATWRHDLLATRVLVDLYLKGFEVLPEAYIRRHAGHLAKLPDGLAVQDGRVIWLEVEMARKTGPAMRMLADALCAIGEGSAAAVLGHKPTDALVAYQAGVQDERGHALSHRQRVSRAVSAQARRTVPITWASCTDGEVGAGAISYEAAVVEADRASAILARLDAAGWRNEGCIVSNYGPRIARVWEDDEAACWAWQVDELPGGRATNISAAKRRCAEVLAAGTA